MTARVEFFFDCSSPWTYLAFERIQPVARQAGAELTFRPILVGGVFNKVNADVYEMRAKPNPLKARYQMKDLQDWANLAGLKISWPDVFPVRSVKAMRGCFHALRHAALPAYARALFEAYWVHGRDIGREDEIAACAAAAGLDPEALLADADSAQDRAALLATTEELMARGGFGSPTMFVDGTDMYFGNDRMEVLAAALARRAA